MATSLRIASMVRDQDFKKIITRLTALSDRERLRGLNPTLFREFATECMELARRTRSPDQRALFSEMASMWQQLEQRWEETG